MLLEISLVYLLSLIHIFLTTNQDTQFVKLYPEEKVAEIQGDHRFFQCAACCTDDTWDAVKPVADMVRCV